MRSRLGPDTRFTRSGQRFTNFFHGTDVYALRSLRPRRSTSRLYYVHAEIITNFQVDLLQPDNVVEETTVLL